MFTHVLCFLAIRKTRISVISYSFFFFLSAIYKTAVEHIFTGKTKKNEFQNYSFA